MNTNVKVRLAPSVMYSNTRRTGISCPKTGRMVLGENVRVQTSRLVAAIASTRRTGIVLDIDHFSRNPHWIFAGNGQHPGFPATRLDS